MGKLFKKKDTWNMTPREKFFRAKRDRIEAALKNLLTPYPRDVDLLVAKFPISGCWTYPKSLTLNYPYNPPMRREIQAYMKQLGWRVKSETLKKGEDEFVMEHAMEVAHLKFCMTHWQAGSTCKRIKIGSELVERDIYEVVCNEGADEFALA